MGAGVFIRKTRKRLKKSEQVVLNGESSLVLSVKLHISFVDT